MGEAAAAEKPDAVDPGIHLEAAMHRARQAGVQKHQLVIDPGLGFGKRKEQNAEIIANLDALRVLDFPILVGPSRKAFLQQEGGDLEFATAAAVTACILMGGHIVRVHNVRAMKQVVQIADSIREYTEKEPRTYSKSGPLAPRAIMGRLGPERFL